MAMFQRYAEAARSPQTISKGYYWAGRAAQDAGDATQANLFLVRAGAYADQFYGQLALERLGRAIPVPAATLPVRSEEHTSELQSLMRISYAVFCLKKTK